VAKPTSNQKSPNQPDITLEYIYGDLGSRVSLSLSLSQSHHSLSFPCAKRHSLFPVRCVASLSPPCGPLSPSPSPQPVVAPPSLKALVWFWWIDETLSANLIYQSDHEIGSTFQVMEQWWRSWWWCGGHDDQVLGLGKEKREKQKAQGKGEIW
jgi:hypothetical protein